MAPATDHIIRYSHEAGGKKHKGIPLGHRRLPQEGQGYQNRGGICQGLERHVARVRSAPAILNPGVPLAGNCKLGSPRSCCYLFQRLEPRLEPRESLGGSLFPALYHSQLYQLKSAMDQDCREVARETSNFLLNF